MSQRWVKDLPDHMYDQYVDAVNKCCDLIDSLDDSNVSVYIIVNALMNVSAVTIASVIDLNNKEDHAQYFGAFLERTILQTASIYE